MTNQDENEKLVIATGDVKLSITKITPKTRALVAKLLDELEEKQKETIPEFEEKYQEIEILERKKLTEDEIREYKRKIPPKMLIKKYILSKGGKYKHSFNELQMQSLGFVLSPKFPDHEKIYRLFYNRLHTAHEEIELRYNGKFKSETIVPKGGKKHQIWYLEPKKDEIIGKDDNNAP